MRVGTCGTLGRMEVCEVPLGNIDFDDETFRISEDLDPVPLEDSLRDVGQLSPVILAAVEGRRTRIVCGFRRLRALRRIGEPCCEARFLTPEQSVPAAAFRIALRDNISLRPLEPLEKARALFTLKHRCLFDQDTLVEEYLPLLGLAAHKNVLRAYLGLHALNSGLRKYLAEGSLTVACAERIAELDPMEQAAMAGLFAKASFSASLQRQILDLTSDLAAIHESTRAGILAGPEIEAALNSPTGTPYQRGEAVFRILYRQRNPRLSAAQDRFQAGKEKLGLPGVVHLTPDPFFERARVRVEFEAGSADGFREISDALQRAARAPELAELFRVR